MSLLAVLGEHGNESASYSALWGYTAPNGREYAILGCFTGTAFIDITDSLNIHEVGFLPCPNLGGIYREMKTYSHYAYIVSETPSSSIQIVDLQYLPDSIRYVGMKTFPGYNTTHTISQEGPYLYLNGNNIEFGGHIGVLDLTVNPENPILRGKWNLYGVHDSRILRDTIYACNIGDNLISVIDARNKDNLVTIRSFPTTPVPMPHNCAVTQDRKYLYSTDETLDGKLKVWNMEDIQDPILVRRFIPPAMFSQDIIHNVEINGNYALIAYYTAGVMVLNISNPANPVLAGFYDTFTEPISTPSFDGVWAVYQFPSGKIIASDRKRGLFVLRLHTEPEIPRADFYVSSQIPGAGSPVTFTDLSLGIPTSWQWTITGPENFSSNINAPVFTFNTIGQYTVKLRVSNSFGSDSVTRINYINVRGPVFNPFSILMNNSFTINTSPSDTSKFKFIWSKTGTHPYFNYKLRLRKSGLVSDLIFSADNNGRDSSLTFRKNFLDSLTRSLGFAYDSAVYTARVFAFNGTDSLQASNIVFFTVRTSVNIQNISSEIPREYKIHNNYPNPFNPSTKIRFEIPRNDFANLAVYDINGKIVEELVNEKLSAGIYEVNFTSKNLSSGIYFYRLKTSAFTETKRMILVK
jgi:choice-of-anchor B domain-containing protein